MHERSRRRYLVNFPFLWGRARHIGRGRAVWMLDRRQSLPACLLVHHLNGDPADDDPRNLAAMFRREHARWHNWDG
jgi:hypothetical protein